MRILMVTPYPPVRDGIAAYAVQEVARLRREGDDVEVLSPGPSAAHHHLDLHSRRGPLALAKRMRAYDRVIVQFHPDVFYPLHSTTAGHVTSSVMLAMAFRLAGDVEVRVHEADYGVRRIAPRALGMRLMWRQVRRVTVHTTAERTSFVRTFGKGRANVEVADHGSSFRARTTLGRAGARERLNLPADDFIFLAIGFIQPHKGFDRAIRAFARVAGSGCRLEVVGSVRAEEPEHLDHLDHLRRLAWGTPGASLREGYVSDEHFDLWLVAADVVLLPYRHIWSSGVVERAAMFGRTVIATRVGGLESQARPGTILVDDDDELEAAMRTALGARSIPVPIDDPWPPMGADRADVMAAIRSRAAAARREEAARTGLVPTVAPERRDGAVATSSPLLGVPFLRLELDPVGPRGRRLAKRLARRLTAWQVDPIVAQVNQLHRAALGAIDQGAADGDGAGRRRG